MYQNGSHVTLYDKSINLIIHSVGLSSKKVMGLNNSGVKKLWVMRKIHNFIQSGTLFYVFFHDKSIGVHFVLFIATVRELWVRDQLVAIILN